ncbi:hypothetical protein [Fortiea contorta]|uniref:hypothetical protein n=1 Tax=Fortiea contorta TaxID=1892405 RepID=UPI000368DB7E|nr:hypothetical protein [Fortiea contorta]
MAMRDADNDRRKNRPVNNPHPPAKEPLSYHELKQLLMNARADRDKYQKEYQEAVSQRNEWEQRAKENQESAAQLVLVQQKIQTYQVEVDELKERVEQNYQLFLDGQQSYQHTLSLYHEEKARATELLTQYEAANSERDRYLTLYNETKAELKYERRSKASIKGWETRRKAENARLKQEISQMVVLLRESLASKDEAVNNLYLVAERMDRIQSLVDSATEETTNSPVGLVQKFRRIWLAIKDILAE